MTTNLSCPGLSGGAPCAAISIVPSTWGQGSSVTYQYANWRITNCDTEQSQTIINTLSEIGGDLPAILEQSRGTSESSSWRTFFKTGRKAPYVTHIYRLLASGSNITCQNHQGVDIKKQPEFVCANPDDFTAYYWNRCRDSSSNAYGFNSQPFIMLCPTFWSTLYPGVLAPNQPVCPDTSKDLPNDNAMIREKTSTLIHEMAHLYIRKNQILPEKYSLKDCAALNSANAARNAQNYAFFAKSVVAGCNEWPDTSKRSVIPINGTSEEDLEEDQDGGTPLRTPVSFDAENVDPSIIAKALDRGE